MTRPLALTLLLSSSHCLCAQAVLTGKVLNQKDGQGISAVNIFAPEIKRGTVTDETGNYTLKNLPHGRIKIEFSHIGFKSLITNIQVEATANQLDVKLTPSPLVGEEIIVTAPTYTAAEQTAYNVRTITPGELKTDGAVTLTETLSEAAGMSQLSTGLGIAKPVIRGLYGNRILTIVNGFRFDNQQWQDEHGLGLTDIGVGKIEIVKGPASLLYGSDALGGAINLIDERPAPLGRTVGDYNLKIYSNTLGAATDFGLRGTKESLNWKIRVGGQSHADYLDGNVRRVPNSRFNGLDLKSNLGWNKKNMSSTWNYHASLYQFGVVELEEADSTKKEDRFERGAEGPHHTVNYHLLTTQNTFFLGRAKLDVDAGAHFNTRKEEEGKAESTQLGDLNMQLNTYSVNPKYSLPLFVHTDLIAGLQAMGQTNTNHGERVIIPDANTAELSANGFLKHSLRRLVIEEGVRYNFYHLKTEERGTVDSLGYMPVIDRNYRTVDGAIGFAYHCTDQLLFKTNFASGYRAPNLAELSSNGLHEGTLNYEIGDPNLKNEKNLEFDLSARYATAAAALEVTVFHNHLNDYIYLAPTSETIQEYRVYRFLQADANLQGLEVSLDWIPPQIGWLDFKSSFSTVSGKRADATHLPFMPADRWNNEIKATFGHAKSVRDGYVKLAVTKAFSQKDLAPTEMATPGYTLVDAGLGGSVNLLGAKTDFALIGKNLFNTTYYDHLSRLKPGSFNDPNVGFNNIGRNFYLYLSFPFELK